MMISFISAVLPVVILISAQYLAVMTLESAGAGGAAAAASAGALMALPFLAFMMIKDRDIKGRAAGRAAGRDAGRPAGRDAGRAAALGQRNDGTGLRKMAAGCICALLGGALCNMLLTRLFALLGIYRIFSNETQEQLLIGHPFLLITGLCLIVPAAEEMAFRGLMQRRLGSVMSAGAALAVTSLGFALVHGDPIQIMYAFPMGLILGLIYEKKPYFILPFCFHAGANLAAVLAAL